MSRRRKHFPDTRTAAPAERPNLAPELPPKRAYVAKVRVTAGECCMCKVWCEQLGRERRTEVYSTQGVIRYCRCGNCGHHWKVIIYGEGPPCDGR